MNRASLLCVVLLVHVFLAVSSGRDVAVLSTAPGADGSGAEPISISLTPSVDEAKRSELLMRLREVHTKLAATDPALLEVGDVPLDVEILSSKHLATYYGVIVMDSTPFKVLFDTGSCEFWVPSAKCKTARCKAHSRLPISKKRKIAHHNGMNIQYLSGKVAGDMVYETVKMGDVTVKNQVVGLARVVSIALLDDVRWDGILGLAYPNPALTAKGVTPIFDTIIKSHILTSKHLSNQFAYYISDSRGSVTFGGADCDLIASGKPKANCIDQFKFVPVTQKTYWTIKIKDVKIKYPGQPVKSGFCPNGGCKAIVDTGTYLIYGPANQVTQMVASSLHSCSHHARMPTFTFEFHVKPGSKPVSLELKPIDYILKFHEATGTDCVVGISPDKDTIWTLGQVFLRSFYTVFDRDEDRIGFARLPRSNFKALNSANTIKKVQKQRKKEKKKDRELRKKAPRAVKKVNRNKSGTSMLEDQTAVTKGGPRIRLRQLSR